MRLLVIGDLSQLFSLPWKFCKLKVEKMNKFFYRRNTNPGICTSFKNFFTCMKINNSYIWSTLDTNQVWKIKNLNFFQFQTWFFKYQVQINRGTAFFKKVSKNSSNCVLEKWKNWIIKQFFEKIYEKWTHVGLLE